MYGYVAEYLGAQTGAVAGWALLWAYGFVAAAVLGAMALFVDVLTGGSGAHVPAIATVCVAATVAWLAAYRGVQVSAILMLVLEAISVAIICLIVVLVIVKHGGAIDGSQLAIKGGFPNLGLAIATAVFSLVGFESATAFGAEARNPLVTIPRAVIGSVVFVSLFFIIATYAEILGLERAGVKPLDQQTFPLGTLVDLFGIGYLRIPLAIGALCSAFSVCLACITTAGRVAFAMAGAGLLPRPFARVEPKHDTPNVAVSVVTGLALLVAAGSLAAGVAPIDVFNNCGTLSAFGFIAIYALISVGAGAYLARNRELRSIDFGISAIAILLLLVPAVSVFWPQPGPQRWFAYYFLAFLLLGWASSIVALRSAAGKRARGTT
jgi:amino acid transporter